VAPPSRIRVGPYSYTLALDQAGVDRKGAAAGERYIGHTDLEAQSIVIAPGLAPDVEAETVLHETLHCCLDASGAVTEWGPDKIELLISRLAPVLLDTLRRNPKLSAYLLEESS
jgi:hypothetical protein